MLPLRVLLLLLLTLPGLLVPAGFGVGRCECTGGLRVVCDGAAPACMSVTGRAVTELAVTELAVAVVRTCCHRRLTPEPAGESITSHVGMDCECKASVVSPVPPKLAPGTKKADPPLTLCGLLHRRVELPLRVVGRVGSGPSRGPPVPGSHRNLPLLL